MRMMGLTPYLRQNSMANFFDDFDRAFWDAMPGSQMFRADVKDLGDSFEIQAELPGINKEDIHVDIDGDALTVSVTREQSKDESGANYIRRERSYGSFRRSFDISLVRPDDITASYNDGILTLSMPKKDGTTQLQRKVEIN